MFCNILGEASVDEFFYSGFTFKLSFFFRFSTWKWLVSSGNQATIDISDWFGMFLISNSIILLYLKSIILGLSFLDLRSLPTKPVFKRILTKALCQYILNLVSKKKLGSFNDLIINTYFQSFICLPRYRYEHFLASIFCKVSLALLNRIQPILERLKENITKPWKPSIIDRSNIGIHSDSRLVILNVHDVKNQSINEQVHAILERCVNSILYMLKK